MNEPGAVRAALVGGVAARLVAVIPTANANAAVVASSSFLELVLPAMVAIPQRHVLRGERK